MNPKMSPTVNVVVAHGRMRVAGLDAVADSLITYVRDLDVDTMRSADVLRLVDHLATEHPGNAETIFEMFTQPF